MTEKISLCNHCYCMTKTVPKGYGRSYGLGYKCVKCGKKKEITQKTSEAKNGT